MAFGGDDPLAFFADAGTILYWEKLPHVFLSTPVHFDKPDQEIGSNTKALSREYMIEYASSALPGLAMNDLVTIDNETYRVRTPRELDDGAISVASLTKL